MLDPKRIENAILTAVAKVSPDDWLPSTVGGLHNQIPETDERVANESHNSLIDAVVALCEEDWLLARRLETVKLRGLSLWR